MSAKLTVLQNVGISGVFPTRATISLAGVGPQGIPGPQGPPGADGSSIPTPTVPDDVLTAVRASDPVEGTAYNNSGEHLSSLIGVDETWPVELTWWENAPGFYAQLGELGAAPTDPFMIGVIFSAGFGSGLNPGDVIVGATVTLDVTGNDTVIIAGMRPVDSTKFLPGSADAPLAGFESKAIGKHVGPATAGTTVFSLALDAPYVIGPDADENDPAIELLAYNLNDGSTINVTDVSWLVANGDIKADWRPPEPQAVVKAAAILLTPSLTPQVGDDIYTVIYSPGANDNDWLGKVEANNDFVKITQYAYTGLWEADPGDVVLLMIDEGQGGQQDTWPTVYARFTGTGFDPIDVSGGTLVSLSCGGAGFGIPALFVGSNWDSPILAGTWPLGPAEFFQPAGVSAKYVDTRSNFTGNLSGTNELQQVLDAVDALPPGDPLGFWLYSHEEAIGFYADQPSPPISNTSLLGWGFDTTPDLAGAGFLIGDSGTTRRYTAMGNNGVDPLGRVAVTTVVGTDSWAEPREVVTIADLPEGYDYISGGPIVDCGDGVGLMILHAEQNGTGWSYWSAHAARVVDTGSEVTITYLGELITTEMDLATTEAQEVHNNGIGACPTAVWEGYAYCYFGDLSPAGQTRRTVARCSLSSISTALGSDSAPSFVKWNGELLGSAWTESALGGTSTHSELIDRSGVWNDADIMLIPDNRLLAVGSEYGDTSDLRSSVASDPLTWSQRFIWDEYQGVGGERIYTTIWSGDPTNPQQVTGPHIYADVLVADDNPSRWEGQYDVYQYRLSPALASIQTPVQTAAAYYTQENMDLTGLAEGVVLATNEATINLPSVTTTSAAWEIWNVGVTGDIAVAADEPINSTGNVTLGPQEVWTFWPLSGPNLWVGYRTSGGGDPTPSATYYPQTPITAQPWSQGDVDLDVPSGTVDAVVVPTSDNSYVQATLNFTVTADVITEATTGAPAFLIDPLFRSLDAPFSGWIWGLGGQDLTISVHGVFGGFPFVGFVHRDGSILDADGIQVFRTIKNGDTLAGTITGIFNAD